jgi:hypothetical protein
MLNQSNLLFAQEYTEVLSDADANQLAGGFYGGYIPVGYINLQFEIFGYFQSLPVDDSGNSVCSPGFPSQNYGVE